MCHFLFRLRMPNFNSQPREGGWLASKVGSIPISHFNSQPREGGWIAPIQHPIHHFKFQLTAARRRLGRLREIRGWYVDFNSQPREGGWPAFIHRAIKPQAFQLTAARRRLDYPPTRLRPECPFQLTAARRRLAWCPICYEGDSEFHSQPREGGRKFGNTRL